MWTCGEMSLVHVEALGEYSNQLLPPWVTLRRYCRSMLHGVSTNAREAVTSGHA
jgi:hypothetical protein